MTVNQFHLWCKLDRQEVEERKLARQRLLKNGFADMASVGALIRARLVSKKIKVDY